MSHSTVIFKMPRAALTAAVDTQAAAVENKRVSYLRRRHRDQWCRQRESALEGLVPDQLGPATGPDAVPVNILPVSPLYSLFIILFCHVGLIVYGCILSLYPPSSLCVSVLLALGMTTVSFLSLSLRMSVWD